MKVLCPICGDPAKVRLEPNGEILCDNDLNLLGHYVKDGKSIYFIPLKKLIVPHKENPMVCENCQEVQCDDDCPNKSNR